MKKLNKTQIIIGAFMLLPLLTLNSFAQSHANTNDIAIGNIHYLQTENEEMRKILEEERISHEAITHDPNHIVKLNMQDISINEEFTASSSAETFKVLLPNSLQAINFKGKKINWEEEKVTFELSYNWPYLHVTILQGQTPKNIKMALTKSHDVVETTERIISLDLNYETDQKSNHEKIGSVKSQIKQPPTNTQTVEFGEEVIIKDPTEIILPVSTDVYGVEEKSFEKGYVLGSIKEEERKIAVYLENDYPLTEEEIKIKFIEENEKIICVHKVGRKVYKDTISVRR